jgi:hypothetical protein
MLLAGADKVGTTMIETCEQMIHCANLALIPKLSPGRLQILSSSPQGLAQIVLSNCCQKIKSEKQEIDYAPNNFRDTNDVDALGHERGLQHGSRFRARR